MLMILIKYFTEIFEHNTTLDIIQMQSSFFSSQNEACHFLVYDILRISRLNNNGFLMLFKDALKSFIFMCWL